MKTKIDFISEKEKVKWEDGFIPKDYAIHQFPGYRDMGAPLIVETNGKTTIIGMFQEQLDEHGKGPLFSKISLFSKIHPDAFNWIVKNSDETQDSNCESFTSCSCGIPGKPKPQSTPRR